MRWHRVASARLHCRVRRASNHDGSSHPDWEKVDVSVTGTSGGALSAPKEEEVVQPQKPVVYRAGGPIRYDTKPIIINLQHHVFAR
jgi:hypothetical protein